MKKLIKGDRRQKRKMSGPLLKRLPDVSGPRNLENRKRRSRVKRGVKKNSASARVAAILSSSSAGEGNLAERFFKGKSCTCVTRSVTACDGRWRQSSVFGNCFQTPPSGLFRSGSRPDLAARETDALAGTSSGSRQRSAKQLEVRLLR